jgi:5'-3' exonuclease
VRFNKREDDMEEDPAIQLENLRKQLTDAQDYLMMLGVPQVRADGVEADDLIAYLAGKMNHPGGVMIVTTDQDMLQLIREASPMHVANCDLVVNRFSGMCDCPPPQSEVRVYSPVKKVMYDRETFISEYGVLPENFRLVKALTGDKSDNIEGIRGFGAKTVVKAFPGMLERLMSPDEVLASGDTLGKVLGKRLSEQEARFRENLTLVDLSVPMLSATAARQARDALRADLGCKEVDFRVRIVRDGVSFKGDGFVNVFRELVHRRRRLLAETKAEDPVDAGEAADAGGLPEAGTSPPGS